MIIIVIIIIAAGLSMQNYEVNIFLMCHSPLQQNQGDPVHLPLPPLSSVHLTHLFSRVFNTQTFTHSPIQLVCSWLSAALLTAFLSWTKPSHPPALLHLVNYFVSELKLCSRFCLLPAWFCLPNVPSLDSSWHSMRGLWICGNLPTEFLMLWGSYTSCIS